MSDESGFSSVTADQAKDALGKLLGDVCRGKVRMEIVEGCHTCVLISKDELNSLEEALEILANTAEVVKMAHGIAALSYLAAQGPLVASGSSESN